jgi:HEPN domain-containing protein
MVEAVAALLLRAAANDVAACKALDATPGMADTVIGFRAQQACEKCLKAVLSAAGIEFTRTHDLTRLTQLLAVQGIAVPVGAEWIDELSPYAVDSRYGLVADGALDRPRAIATIDAMLDWARGRTGDPGAR